MSNFPKKNIMNIVTVEPKKISYLKSNKIIQKKV